MLPSLAAFAIGVGVLQQQAALPSPPWLPGLLGFALLLAARWRTSRGRAMRSFASGAALIAGTTLLGFGYAAWRAEFRLAEALPAQLEGVDVAIVGVVDDLPRVSDRGVRFAFRVERTGVSDARIPSRISLAWHPAWSSTDVETEVPAVRAGERWALTVRLARPHGNLNRGGFDLEAWLLERNLRAVGYVRPDAPQQRLDVFAGGWLDHVQRLRESIRSRAQRVLGTDRDASVLVALAIGDQSGIDAAGWTIFNRTGTGHLISVSGLHVTVFALLAGGAAFALARRSAWLTSRLPAVKVGAACGLVASCGYVLLAGAEVPAQRTLAMLAVSAVGLWLGRPGTGAVVWMWALAAVLIGDPWAVLAPGFWLSFFAVGLLIYVSCGRSLMAQVPGRWQRLRRKLAVAAHTQWAVTLGLVPLSLALFQQVSLVGPLANAIAIPAVTFAIVPVTLVAALTPFDAIWQLAQALLAPLMRVLEALAALPGAAWAQHQPPLWAVALGIAGIAWCLAPRGVPGRALGAIALAPLIVAWPRPPDPGTFRVTVLDVGQGTAVVVQTHRHALLYDTGPRWHADADAGGRIVAPFLRAAGIRALDAMLVSHRDLDHAGGAISVLQSVPVGFVISSLPEDSAIVERQLERGLHLRCRTGQHWDWDGVRFEILFPGPDHYVDPWRKSNDLSCVLRVAAAGGAALLTGDIESVSEIELVTTRRESLAADVLIVPHHGSRTSSTSSFIAAVAADHAVFTVGHRNRFNHPRADIVERYRRTGAAIHRTDRAGALTFAFEASGPGPPESERARAPRYWHARP